jgi:hypothetical protein
MYSLGTLFVSGIYVQIPCIKEIMTMIIIIIIIIIMQLIITNVSQNQIFLTLCVHHTTLYISIFAYIDSVKLSSNFGNNLRTPNVPFYINAFNEYRAPSAGRFTLLMLLLRLCRFCLWRTTCKRRNLLAVRSVC